MSVLLFKILWTRESDGITTNITDAISMNLTRGLEIKNNTIVFNLKNHPVNFLADGSIQHKYIDLTGNILFNEEDQFKIYANNSDDMSVIESSVWSNDTDNIEEPSSTFLRGTYFLKDYKVNHSITGSPITITCADKTFILFNKLLAQSFPVTDGLTAPEIIQKAIQYSTQNDSGIYFGPAGTNEENVKYDVQALLVSEGGHIQDTRKSVKENGDANPITDFPVITFSKIWKAVYEWVSELSDIEHLNTAAEIISNPVYGRPFIYYVDEDNRFHWFETDDVVTETSNIDIGTTTGVVSMSLQRSIFDVINFIVFRGGEDFYGAGTLGYDVDPQATSKSLKMRVIAMTDIAQTLIENELGVGNLTLNNTDGVYTFSGNRYDRTDITTFAEWNNVGYTSDSDYNEALRDEVLKQGKTRARAYISGLSSPRWKGTIVRKGRIYQAGELFTITDKSLGLTNQNIRITSVTDNFTKSGWTTSLTVEEDQDAIVSNS